MQRHAPPLRAPSTLRTPVRARRTPPRPPTATSTDRDYASLKGVKVCRPDDGVEVDLLSTFKAGPGDRTVLVALTHCADLAPQELVPKLVSVGVEE